MTSASSNKTVVAVSTALASVATIAAAGYLLRRHAPDVKAWSATSWSTLKGMLPSAPSQASTSLQQLQASAAQAVQSVQSSAASGCASISSIGARISSTYASSATAVSASFSSARSAVSSTYAAAMDAARARRKQGRIQRLRSFPIAEVPEGLEEEEEEAHAQPSSSKQGKAANAGKDVLQVQVDARAFSMP